MEPDGTEQHYRGLTIRMEYAPALNGETRLPVYRVVQPRGGDLPRFPDSNATFESADLAREYVDALHYLRDRMQPSELSPLLSPGSTRYLEGILADCQHSKMPDGCSLIDLINHTLAGLVPPDRLGVQSPAIEHPNFRLTG